MLANHKGEIPFVILIIPYLLGITLGLNFLQCTYINCLSAVLIIMGLIFIVLNLNYVRFSLYKSQWIGGLFITLFLFLSGWIRVLQYNELSNGHHFSKKSASCLIVKINNEPTVKNGLVRFTADVEQGINNGKRTAFSGTLLVAVKDSGAKNLYYGDVLLIPGKYNTIDPPYNPAEFNYKKYLANQNIYYQAFLYPKQFVVIAHDAGNPVIAYSLRLRQRLVEKLKRNMHDTSAIAVASTLILGYKADLSNDVLQAYSKTGTIHVLSVSGAHVAIIYILLNILLGFLKRYKHGKLFKAVLIIILIGYYALLTGFSPAVCRAAVMITLVILGKTYSRYINTLNILAISALLLLLYNPLLITDVGFQLSYLAVAGLIVFQPIIYKLISFKNKWADKLWALCSVSVAAQVITFPLSAFYFHQFPVYFLISNLFIIIPSSLIMYTGILYLILPQLPAVSKILAYILERSIVLMNKALVLIEHAPFASIGKIWLNTTEYILLYIIILCLFYYLFERALWQLKISAAAIILLCLSLTYKKVNTFRSDRVTFLNMKKHQGLVFKHGDQAIVLTDIKPNDKAYQYTIQPYLDSNQIATTALYDLKGDIAASFLVKKANLIQFKKKLILIFDRQLTNNSLPQKIKIDDVFITGSPHTTLNAIKNNFDFQTLIVDANNNNYLSKELEQQAQTMHINYYLLKRNNSFAILSN